MSAIQMYVPTITHAMSTTSVPWTTCDWVGHSTFFSSPQDSAMKRFDPASSLRRAPVCVFGDALCGRTWAARGVAPAPAAWAEAACACRRARRCDRVIFAIGLPRLAVRGVLTAPAAVLREL